MEQLYNKQDLKNAFFYYYARGFPHQVTFDEWLKDYKPVADKNAPTPIPKPFSESEIAGYLWKDEFITNKDDIIGRCSYGKHEEPKPLYFERNVPENIDEFISVIRNSFIGSEEVYTKGSCYRFYEILKCVFPMAKAYYNSDHVITEINGKYYDITGEVKKENHLLMSEHYQNSIVKDNSFTLEHSVDRGREAQYFADWLIKYYSCIESGMYKGMYFNKTEIHLNYFTTKQLYKEYVNQLSK